jgi:hypothetical protein
MFLIINFNAAEIFEQPCFALPVSYEVWTIQCLNREKFATGEKTKSLFKRTSAAKLRLLEHSSDGPL